ncbi:MAG: hypothetical protein OQL11_05900 [Gammaproteobacteria bacterium]|nr:hypothetical protein [Gammaproteobacteria bacterium]
MTPYIRQNIIGNAPKVPISDAEFEAISQARVVLAGALALEESYDLLIGNYVEVEQELLAAAASSTVRDHYEYQDFFELRSTINRRVVNLLTATRLYLDQAPQRLADCAVDPAAARAEFKQRTSDHYDTFFGYRFLEALRNHVQHCGLAVHRLIQNFRWIGEGDDCEMEVSIQPFAERLYLAEDGGFKKRILDEMPEKVVLTLVIREYLQCIGDLHMLVRSHVSDRVKNSRKTMQTHISKFAATNNDAAIGLTAFRTDSQGMQESLPLLLDWDDVREKLVLQNSGLVALGRHVVTGRAK